MKTERPQDLPADSPLAQLGKAIEGDRYTMLTLAENDGQLRARPMTPQLLDAQGHLWFLASKQSLSMLVPDASGGNARGVACNLSFMRQDQSDYVSIAGSAVTVDDAARKQALWSLMARPWFSGPEDPDLTLLCVQAEHVSIWDSPDSRVVRLLAMAASVVAAREIGIGHQQAIDITAPAAADRSGS